METEEEVKVAETLELDHRKGTPQYGYFDDGSVMEDSGFSACRLIAKPPTPEPPRQLPPRRPLPNYAHLAARAAAFGIPYDPTARPPKRRVVRGKPRPGVKGPRPRIGGPPRLRDKPRVRCKVEGREQSMDTLGDEHSHAEVDNDMTCDEEDGTMHLTVKKEQSSPGDSTYMGLDQDSVLHGFRGAGTEHFPATFDADQYEETKPYIKTDLQIHHASIPVPNLSSLGINLCNRQGAQGTQGGHGGVSAPPASPGTSPYPFLQFLL